VPIPAPLRDYLDEQLLSVDGEYVFGGPAKARKTIERGTEAMRAAGLTTFHGCRHTYASYMIAAGVNAKALSEFMGHSSIAITFDKYGKLMPGAQQEAAGLLDAFLARAAEADTTVSGATRTAPHPEQNRP